MPDAAALGAGGGAPLTADDWRAAARAVAVARRAGAVAVSVRHITFHLSSLELQAGQAHAHGHHAHGPAPARTPARGRGSRGACRGRSRGHCAGAAPAAPLPSPSQSSSSTVAAHSEVADAAACAASALSTSTTRSRGWLRSAAFHFWRRVALRRAFFMLRNCEVASLVQYDMQCVVATTPLLAARPCGPPGPHAGSANLLPLSADSECGRVKRPPSPFSAEACSSPLLKKRLHALQMNVHAPAFYPSVPDDSEL